MAKKNKTLPGPCKDVREGYTEHGGCITVTYFFDSHYKPIPKEQATRAIVHEYDEKERSVFRDYLTLDKGRVVEPRRQEDRPEQTGEEERDASASDEVRGEGFVPEELVIREVRIEDEGVTEIQIAEIFIEGESAEDAIADGPDQNEE